MTNTTTQFESFKTIKLILIITLFLTANFSFGQSKEITAKQEKQAIEKLAKQGTVKLARDGWFIDPDLWSQLSYKNRKALTLGLYGYYKKYVERAKKDNRFCFFYDMATEKRIATWHKDKYKEYD